MTRDDRDPDPPNPVSRTSPEGDNGTDSLFEIRLQGHMDDRWAEWFDGMTIIRDPEGTTLLSGLVADQAALQGLLRRIADLGMTLLSVNAVGTGAR